MSRVDDQYYRGYEGEPEIGFYTIKEKIVIWAGFFDDIMEQMKPSRYGWTGIAYYYHLHTGWYDEDFWQIPDLEECLRQFEGINISECRFEGSKNVLASIRSMLSLAIQENENVWISEG